MSHHVGCKKEEANTLQTDSMYNETQLNERKSLYVVQRETTFLEKEFYRQGVLCVQLGGHEQSSNYYAQFYKLCWSFVVRPLSPSTKKKMKAY